MHKSKETSVVIKLDYEKTYDKVNLDFLLDILKARGFGEKMRGWIKNIVFGGSVSVLANGEESATFKTGKGLRQGGPLSPLLFNLVVDALTKMLSKAIGKGLVRGLLDQFRSEGTLALQYADDTLLFSSSDPSFLKNLKCVLILFEKVSVMKINFHKSECIPMNLDEESIHIISHVLNYPVGSLPNKYLEIPLHFEKLKREDLQPLLDNLIRRISGWRGRLLAHSSRLTLVKTCLASVHVYLLSFLKFPKWDIRLLESQMAHCLWNNDSDSHKYHLANWQLVSMRKEFSGLGVPNMRDLNICLLGSWLKRYCFDSEKIWKSLIDFRYKTPSPNVLLCLDVGASNFWKGVIWAAQVARMGFR
jgi:hypothetical protein